MALRSLASTRPDVARLPARGCTLERDPCLFLPKDRTFTSWRNYAGGTTGMAKDEAAVYTFCSELLNKKQVSDATFAAAKDVVGEKGVVDLIGVMGWYHTVSMLLNVDRYPLPDGQQPELKPLS